MDALADTRFRLTVHYDGSAFHGWQVQPDQRTVQGVLETALSRLADGPKGIMGSGRTDAGVHSTGQVFSVDMAPRWDAPSLRKSLNALLPDDAWIESAAQAPPDFHPRYDAARRTYRYEIGLRPEAASPFHKRWCWPLGEPLDLALLRQAASAIPGERSFGAFAKAGQPERGERCHVYVVAWSETVLGTRLTITADRYLHHMVRYLTGTMVDIARGRRPLDDMARLLDNEPDMVTSPPAPASGLFLHHVEYPEPEAS
ncbi:MAG: tRNA pseudouridine(38-40) synthase TruA [Gemmatimonadetes bacterium]|nr:tRNA pseudouridine(38-40) synthase TruA [Gemmatimonadota bacterium]